MPAPTASRPTGRARWSNTFARKGTSSRPGLDRMQAALGQPQACHPHAADVFLSRNQNRGATLAPQVMLFKALHLRRRKGTQHILLRRLFGVIRADIGAPAPPRMSYTHRSAPPDGTGLITPPAATMCS